MTKKTPIIAASLLAADFARLGEEANAAVAAGADWLHLDVMDNHYVPNLTIGAPVCAALARACNAPIDAHLMTEKPESLVAAFARAGAARLTFHPNTTPHAHRLAAEIKKAGLAVGVAYNPATPLQDLPHLLELADLVLIMTVNPGFGGQRFINAMLPKIEEAKKLITAAGGRALLQVDGGINAQTAASCARAGADVLVAGSAIFGADNYAAAVAAIRAN